MNDYYELLGVDAGADKDAIKDAYRDRLEGASQAERAKLNKAWNVLSDPIQRGRYNDFLASSDEFGVDDDGDDDAPRVVAKRSSGGAKPARERPPARVPLEPTIQLPSGVEFAPKRARNLALAFDAAILLVIFFVSLNVVPGAVDKNFTKQVDTYNAEVKTFDKLDSAKSKAQDAADAATAKAKAAAKKNTTDAAALQQKADDLTKKAKTAKSKADAQDKVVKDQAKQIPIGPQLAAVAFVFAAGLLYTVPMSVRTGQTFGKRIQKIRLARTDGSPPGWWPSLVHFGLPMLIAFGLFGQLQGLAGILGLGAVLWNLRDRNRQGLHDKLAKTIVVADIQ